MAPAISAVGIELALTRREFHISVDRSDTNAAHLLADSTGLSINAVKSAMQKGAVWVTNTRGTSRLRRAKKALDAGNQIHFYYDEAVLQADIPSPVKIADEDDYSVWYKPPGVFSQGSKWGDHCTLSRWVALHDPKHRPVFVVHRLDRAARGLMLVAHAKSTARQLSNLFATRAVNKEYQAIVHGCFPGNDQLRTLDSSVGDKPAISHVSALAYERESNRSLLAVRIETGRKHQIRKQLSAAGFPIVGDRLYGGGTDCDCQLCAVSLRFICPQNGMQRDYDLPKDMRLALGGES